jgi:hypothetical protein
MLAVVPPSLVLTLTQDQLSPRQALTSSYQKTGRPRIQHDQLLDVTARLRGRNSRDCGWAPFAPRHRKNMQHELINYPTWDRSFPVPKTPPDDKFDENRIASESTEEVENRALSLATGTGRRSSKEGQLEPQQKLPPTPTSILLDKTYCTNCVVWRKNTFEKKIRVAYANCHARTTFATLTALMRGHTTHHQVLIYYWLLQASCHFLHFGLVY